MRQRDKEKPNKTTPENTKHPTQEPGEEIYSLEDILAEYGTRRSTVRTAVPVNSPLDQPEGKVLAFPRRPAPMPQEKPEDSDAPEEPETASPPGQTEQEPESSSQQEEEEQEASQEEEENAGEDDSGVVEFPPEESLLFSLLKRLGRKADRYADQMFQESEEMDEEDIRRLEELIPGTDQEDEPPQPQTPVCSTVCSTAPGGRSPCPRTLPPSSWPVHMERDSRACACAPWPSSCWLRWLYSSCWCLPST